jgi:hypothetical protein
LNNEPPAKRIKLESEILHSTTVDNFCQTDQKTFLTQKIQTDKIKEPAPIIKEIIKIVEPDIPVVEPIKSVKELEKVVVLPTVSFEKLKFKKIE